MDRFCKNCETKVVASEVLLSEGKHYGKLVCPTCERWLDWMPKPKNNGKRRSADKKLVKKFGRGFCELCLRKDSSLPHGQTLEGHHVLEHQNGGPPVRENTWVLCTRCHKLINHTRHWSTYAGEQLTGDEIEDLIRGLGGEWTDWNES